MQGKLQKRKLKQVSVLRALAESITIPTVFALIALKWTGKNIFFFLPLVYGMMFILRIAGGFVALLKHLCQTFASDVRNNKENT